MKPTEAVELWKRFWGAEATAGADPDNSLEAWYEGTGVWSSPIPAGADPVWQPEWFHGDPVVWPPMVIMPMEGIIAMNADLPS